MQCRICKRPLEDPADPTTQDCGGDCLKCMAEIALDPECIAAMETITNAPHLKGVAALKHQAYVLKKAEDIPHHEALERVAIHNGFVSWKHLLSMHEGR